MLGVSFDPPADNAAFARKEGYPFPLLCDTSRAMGLAYGTCERADDAYARRYTYVIDEQGRIERAIDTREPAAQAEELLARL